MFCFTPADVNTVKRVFKNLRDRFMKMRREYKPSGSGGGVSVEPSWQFYKQLEFLSPFLKHRPTLGNLSDSPMISNTIPEESNSELCETVRTADSGTNFAVYDDSQVMAAASTVVLPPIPAEVELLVIDDGESTNNSESSANNSFQAGPIPKKKAKRVNEKGNNMKAILNALESSNEFIKSASKKQEPDADDLFGQSIGKELKELTDYQKSLAKLRIQQILHEIRWEREPQN